MQLSLAQISSIATAYNQGRMDYSASEASFYANIAVQTLASQDRYRSLESVYNFSVTSGTTSIPLPTDFYNEVSLSLSSGSNSAWNQRLLPETAQRIDSFGTTMSIPRYYNLYANAIIIAPTSDSTYSGVMRYTTKIPAMVLSTDTPDVQERYHYAVALKTAELLSAARNDVEQEALNHQRYLDYMTSIPNDRALRQLDKLQGVQPVRHGERR